MFIERSTKCPQGSTPTGKQVGLVFGPYLEGDNMYKVYTKVDGEQMFIESVHCLEEADDIRLELLDEGYHHTQIKVVEVEEERDLNNLSLEREYLNELDEEWFG